MFENNVYMDTVIKESKKRDGEDGNEIFGGGDKEDCLSSCMQMTWFCVRSRNKT